MDRETLEEWFQELTLEIQSKEAEIRPMLEELDRLREQHANVGKLVGSLGGESNLIKDDAKLNWAEDCRQQGLHVGGDSAHRVMRRG